MNDTHQEQRNVSVYSDYDSDGSPEIQKDSQPVPNPRKKKIVQEITFEAAVEELSIAIEALPPEDEVHTPSRGRPRTKRKLPKVPWDELAFAFQKESILGGIKTDTLSDIWQLVSHPSIKVPLKAGTTIILSLVPVNEQVSSEAIRDIVFMIPRFPAVLKLAILKYLVGIYDYNMCDPKAFDGFSCYSMVFFTERSNALIPWTCALVKRISKPGILEKSFINDLMDLLYRPFSVEALRAVVDLLRYYKIIRPDLLPQRVFQMGSIGISKAVQVPENFKKALFSARCRINNIPETSNNSQVMEIDGEPFVEKMDRFVGLLNDQCFPEFQLYKEGDPELGDIPGILKLGKYDLMRCALRTIETLLLVIEDAEAMEHLNTFLSIIFQHKFKAYDPKQAKRYNFVLTRCLELTLLGQKGIPAVVEWLLDYMLWWDCVLFKEYIIELLRYLPPTNFSDGYIHVIVKLQSLFVFGKPIDRILIWDILSKLVNDWIRELRGINEEDEIRNKQTSDIQNAIVFVLDFMYSLVCEVAAANGEKDEVFLVQCCEAYIKMNDAMNEIRSPPCYVFPPYALWVMVVLNDSIIPMDRFCLLAERLRPRRSINALKKTKHQEIYRVYHQRILMDLFQFFGWREGTGVPFELLFGTEVECLTKAIENSKIEPDSGSIADMCTDKLRNIFDGLRTYRAENFNGFREILLEPARRGTDFASSIDTEKLRILAPNIQSFLKFLEDGIIDHLP